METSTKFQHVPVLSGIREMCCCNASAQLNILQNYAYVATLEGIEGYAQE